MYNPLHEGTVIPLSLLSVGYLVNIGSLNELSIILIPTDDIAGRLFSYM